MVQKNPEVVLFVAGELCTTAKGCSRKSQTSGNDDAMRRLKIGSYIPSQKTF
jgi:hypothetical protein